MSSIPLLRVNIQPSNPNDYMQLKESLNCLDLCEESVKFWTDPDDGNLTIATNGEINLEKCILDAKEM